MCNNNRTRAKRKTDLFTPNLTGAFSYKFRYLPRYLTLLGVTRPKSSSSLLNEPLGKYILKLYKVAKATAKTVI